jgi:predicted PurR-regulated permease PerM
MSNAKKSAAPNKAAVAIHPMTLANACFVILTIIVVFTVLLNAKTVFAPVIAALLLGLILTPLSDIWERLKLPAALSALLSMLLALTSILLLLLLIEPYVTKAIERAPVIWNELRETIEELRRLLRGLEDMSEDLAKAIEPAEGDTVANTEDSEEAVNLPSISDALFYAPQFGAQFMIFSGTLYFFLMVKNDLYDWVSGASIHINGDDLRQAGEKVSQYVLTISAINFCFAVLVAIVMRLYGMPSPILWGMLAFGLNFVLYLGPIALAGLLTVTGIVVFDGAYSYLPAATYLAMNATEGQFVTPTLVGKSLSINPLLVFLSLVFWLWLWGPIGGIIAIPLLVWGVAVYDGLTAHAISSGTPGKLRPTSSAGSSA